VLAAVAGGILGGLIGGLPVEGIALFAVLVAAAWPATCFVCGLYSVEDLRSWATGATEASQLAFAALALSWPLYAVSVIVVAPPQPALAAFLACLATVTVGATARGLARAHAHRSEPLRQRTVIVGSGVVAGQVVDRLRAHPEFGLVPVGIVDDDVYQHGNPDLPTLGRLDQLTEVLDRTLVDRVIIAFSRAGHNQLLSIVRTCRDRRVAVDVVPRLFEFLGGARVLDEVGGMPLLSIGVQPLSRSSRATKRALDIAVSACALVLLAPLLAAIALAVKLDARGPVLFRQPRPGRDGKPFQLLKFRSMHPPAEGEEHAPRPGQPLAKDGADARVTRVGAALRRFSLDELPQFVNVLKADMSLVGPRPLVMSEAPALGETWHERRLDLRPGMTGLWQVSGRSNMPFHDRLRLDYQYVVGWSLARDVEILLATLPAVLSGRGAY
jgi:exopolysaccharide biosynthesis polyprenyl glycosylphosphotransferase